MQALENDIKSDPDNMLYLDNRNPEDMAKKSEAQYRSIAKFNKEHTTSVLVRLNKNTDQDILEKLDTVPSKQGYIKKLIRDDIKNDQGNE